MGVLVVAGTLDDDRLQYRAEVQEFEIFPPPFPAAQLLKNVEEVLKAAGEQEARNKGSAPGARLHRRPL